MMDTVGEPNTLEVNLHRLKVGRLLVALITCINGLQCLANAKIVLTILVKENISTLQSGFCQIINQLFLLE